MLFVLSLIFLASYFLSLFELSGIFGSIFSGIVTDMIFSRKIKNFEEKNKTCQSAKNKSSKIVQQVDKKPESIRIRMIANIIFLLGLILSMHFLNFFVDKDTNNLFSIGAMGGFFCYGSISLLGIIAMEFTSKTFSGTSHGIASLAANFGAIFAGIPFGLVSKFYSWNFAFKFVEAFAITTFVFLILLRNSVSRFDEQKITTRTKKVQ